MERLVIVANRLPVRGTKQLQNLQWETSPGGLVTALFPVLQKNRGAWVGWAGQSGPAPKPFKHDGLQLFPVGLSSHDLNQFYYGFCNGTLWPLYHDSVRPPEFDRKWWWNYVEINRRFADHAANVLENGNTCWVHDYQLQLVPRFVRERNPDSKIGFFLHIPFPPEEIFAHLPWRKQILDGILGADLVGFQTRFAAQNFVRAAKRYTEAEGTWSVLNYQGRKVHIDAFPISIDVKMVEDAAKKTSTIQKAEAFRKKMGNRKIILGVDRLDYTKGIDLRLNAFETLLENKRLNIHDFVFVQVVVPSRESVPQYQELKRQIEGTVGRVNGDYGEPGRFPLHYLHQSFAFEELIALYRAADVMLITPLADGMNLVAKEYVMTRTDNSGVLILSEFAGAAIELKDALLINPHDVDGLAATIELALNLPRSEGQRRMRLMRSAVRRHTVHDWADQFIAGLSK